MMAKFFALLLVLALVLPVRSCIPTQGPDEDEWWDELSPTTSLLLQYSTLPIEQSTSTAASTTSSTTSSTSTTTTPSTTSTTTTTTTSTTTTTTILDCLDATWIHNSATGRCYKAIVMGEMWQAAENMCVTFGAELVSLADQTEQDYVYTTVIVPSASPNSDWYIGLMQTAETYELSGMSQWSDGTPYNNAVWSNWETAPPGFSGSNACVTMHVLTGDSTAGQWEGQMCNLNLAYVCEMAAMPTG